MSREGPDHTGPFDYKLSICIPTYNRSSYLRQCLDLVIPQIEEFKDRIELVISNNCSTDDTEQVVNEYSKRYPIHYFTNDKNYGINHNILFITQSRANGEFCWILGDDDKIRDGTIRNLMGILDQERDIDFVYVNFLVELIDQENMRVAYEGRPVTREAERFIGSKDLKKGKKEFDRIISDDMFSLTAIYSSVFRVSVCKEAALRFKISDEFSNLNSTLTITIIFIDTMHGRMGYSTGVPWLVCGTKNSWSKYLIAVTMRLSELYDYQEEYGIAHDLVEVQRKRYVINNSGGLLLMYFLAKVNNLDAPYIDQFNIFQFLKKYGKYPGLYRSTIKALIPYLLSKLKARR